MANALWSGAVLLHPAIMRQACGPGRGGYLKVRPL